MLIIVVRLAYCISRRYLHCEMRADVPLKPTPLNPKTHTLLTQAQLIQSVRNAAGEATGRSRLDGALLYSWEHFPSVHTPLSQKAPTMGAA